MEVREYEDDDLAAVQRMWQECGWVDEDDAAHLTDFLTDADAIVAEVDGEAEACTAIHDGTLDHTGTPLPAAVVTAVTTSRIGRKQGLANATLQTAIRRAAGRGMAVSVLGMFEQGFYDASGFGTGSEMLFVRTDPAHLDPSLPYRRPQRLTLDDIPDMVAALRTRDVVHGGVMLTSVPLRRAERQWDDNGFGLGYRDADGELTHFVWCSTKDEHGPYQVRDWAWRDTTQLLELLGVLRSLGDQVRTVVMPEPAGLQLQVLIDRPGRLQLTRTTGEHRFGISANAWWQARILDVPTCVAALTDVGQLHCNLHLTDPLDLDGVAGDWVLHLGRESTAVRGHDEDLRTLTASVNAFTRLWLGVRPATTLAATDGLEGTDELITALDRSIRLPRPDVQTDF